MKQITRRDFLRLTAAGLGGLALDQVLSACGQSLPPYQSPTPPESAQDVVIAEATTIPTDTFSPTPVIENPKSPTPGIPDLAVARGGESARGGTPEDLVRAAINSLGGMQRFVPVGSKVIIKPNICTAYHTYEYAATTNPWVVGEIVRLCLGAGAASVQVMDYPFGGTPEAAYVRSGIEEQVLAAGGKMALMPGFKFITADIPHGIDLHQVEINDDVLKADVLIDLPIAKHHSLAHLTLGMKNLMGVIADRGMIHANMGQRLADLASLTYPTLTVVDAVRILTDHGPTGGSLDDVKKLDTIIASADLVAADSYATTLFGMRPDEISYIQAGTAMGLGQSNLGALKIEEISL